MKTFTLPGKKTWYESSSDVLPDLMSSIILGQPSLGQLCITDLMDWFHCTSSLEGTYITYSSQKAWYAHVIMYMSDNVQQLAALAIFSGFFFILSVHTKTLVFKYIYSNFN